MSEIFEGMFKHIELKKTWFKAVEVLVEILMVVEEQKLEEYIDKNFQSDMKAKEPISAVTAQEKSILHT